MELVQSRIVTDDGAGRSMVLRDPKGNLVNVFSRSKAVQL